MSFHLHQGDDLGKLAAELASLLRITAGVSGNPDPFSKETITLPHRGIGRWLSLRIAEINGICPAMELPYPGAFLYNYVFMPMMGERSSVDLEEDALPFSPATICWRILKLLPNLEKQREFERVRTFVNQDPFLRYQLACRMATLYDRYMTYRPHMMKEWESGEQTMDGADACWQARLWRELIALDKGEIRHFSGLYLRFLEESADRERAPAYLLPLLQKRRVFYFGASSLPPAHLDVLMRLARYPNFDIHFFTVNPCREEWGFAQSLKDQLRDQQHLTRLIGRELALDYQVDSNPLLGSLGRSGREFFSLLLAYDEVEEHSYFSPNESAPQMLATIQEHILANTPPGQPETAPAPTDTSIVIHACHSPMREVEVLYDQLLELFRTQPGLQPREIAVYTPDIETYAPYIEAVFGQTSPGQTGHIPYTIADKALFHEHEECRAFLQLLEIATSRFKATEVLALLDHAVIRDRFNIPQEKLPRLATLLKEANLSWGLSAGFRGDQGSAKTYTNTWEFTLDRLITGVALWDPDECETPLEISPKRYKCIPCNDAGGEAALIGSLAEFVSALKKLYAFCKLPHTSTEWSVWLAGCLSRFFLKDRKTPYGLILIRQTLDKFTQYTSNAECADTGLLWVVVKAWLQEQLSGSPGSERFVSGKLTFSRFQAVRNIPMRVVCMLGMGDGAFPCQGSRLSFDLMERQYGAATHQRSRRNIVRAIGDRRSRDEDRYAFLEALMAARERLIILFTGQSNKDNKRLPPSVLVSELLDTIERTFDLSHTSGQETSATQQGADRVVVWHPLHPFSPEYYRTATEKRDPRTHSFSNEFYEVAQHLAQKWGTKATANKTPPLKVAGNIQTESDTLERQIIALEDLVSFFKNPARFLFTRQLETYLELKEPEKPADEERLECDGLEKYEVKNRLLEKISNADDIELGRRQCCERWVAEGYLPPHTLRELKPILDEVLSLEKRRREFFPGTPRILPLDLPLNNNTTLHGLLRVSADMTKQMVIRPARRRAKDLVETRIRHLAACAIGLEITTYGFYLKQENPSEQSAVAQDKAKNTLQNLTSIFRAGLSRPLCFDPEIGQLLEQGKEATIQESHWQGSEYAQGVDSYTKHIFGETLPDPASTEWRTMREVARILFHQ